MQIAPTLRSVPAGPAPEAATLLGLLRKGLARWRLIVLILLAAMAAAFLYLRTAPKRYTAEALVMATGTTGSLLKDIARPDGAYLPLEAVQTQVEALRAASVGQQVFLALEPGALTAIAPVPDGAPGDGAARFTRFRSAISIEQRGLSAVIAIAFTAPEPELAAVVANRLAAAGIAEARRRVGLDGDGLSAVLDERLARLAADLDTDRASAEDFRARNDLYGTQNPDALTRELSELAAVLAAAQGARADAEAALAAAGDGSASPAVLASPRIQSLNAGKAEAEDTLNGLRAVYGSAYPEVAAATATLRGLERDLRDETARILDAARQEVAAANLKEEAVRAAIDSLGRRLAEARRLERTARQLDDKAAATERLYQSLLDSRAARAVTADDRLFVPPIQLLSAAMPPPRPSHPKPAIVLALAAFAGLLLAGIVVVAAEADRARRTA